MNHEGQLPPRETQPQQVRDFEPFPEDHVRRPVYVKRTSGEAEAGWLLEGEYHDAEGQVVAYEVIKFTEDGVAQKRVPKEQHDLLQVEKGREFQERAQRQEKLGVRAVGVISRDVVHTQAERPQPNKSEQLSLELETIAAKYGKDGGMNLWRYGSGMMNKREAQAAGDGQGSMDYGQQAGQALQELRRIGGADASKDADRYLSLMQQLQAERDRS